MLEAIYKKKISSLLALADVQINGSRPWDIQVHNPQLYGRVLGQGSLGLGEAYMQGWWDCSRLDLFFEKIISADLAKKVVTLKDLLFFLTIHLLNQQKGRKSFQVGEQHYNAGNDLFNKMLGKHLVYTCGYWQDADSLDTAQRHKLELVCRKLKLKPGMKVLDIGCGWGDATFYMAKHYQVKVIGISISEEQIKLAQQNSNGLDVEFRLQDYRDLDESFDRIFSLGMFEHVGFKNYHSYFKTAHRCLADDGLFLLHTIGHNKTSNKVDPWIEKYIFPNSILPSSELICQHSSQYFNLEDWHNFGLDYNKTLLAWHNNINQHWQNLDYDQTFQRMWNYYLLSCAGAFQSYRNHLWQIVFSKSALKKPYKAVRSAI